MDLDLNQEPSLDTPHGSVLGLGSLLNESDGGIEERMRQLKQVTLRNRHSQRSAATVDGHDSIMEKGRFSKSSRDLIGNALRMVKKVESDDNKGGGIYDCNICFETPKEPILTSCGHLFCWSCFYLLSYCHSNVKECPACKGEVKDTSIVPIYGNNGSDQEISSQRSKVKVAPRPQAQRVESARQLAGDRE